MGAALSGYYRRDLEWHFVWLPASGETAQYNLKSDPGQLEDKSRFYPSLVETFKADINTWRETYETKSDTP